MTTSKYLLKPVFWGVFSDQPVDMQRQIALVNVINLIGFLFQFIFFLILIYHGYSHQSSWNLLAAVFHAVSLLCQYLGYQTLARHILATTFPLVIVILTFSYGGENSTEMYLYLCFPLVFFLFKSKNQFRFYSIYLTLLLALLYWSRFHGWIPPEAYAWTDILWYTNFITSFLSFLFLSWTIQRESLFYENVQRNEQEAMEKLLDDIKSSDMIKGRFLRIFSHDLRAPFHGILGVIDLLIEDENPMTLEEARPLLIRLHESSKNTLLLLDNLVDWTKSQQNILHLRAQVLPMAELVLQTVMLYEQVAHMKNIQLISKIPTDLHVWADRPTVMTILRNLINNAIKYSHPGGQIIISSLLNPNYVTISVQDFGTGMQDSTRETLFKDGQDISIPGTNGEKGNGLGLTLCKDFVEKNEGQLQIESVWGKGTTIHFTLPRQPAD